MFKQLTGLLIILLSVLTKELIISNCLYYFEDDFVMYHLKDLKRKKRENKVYPFTYNKPGEGKIVGKIAINICDGVRGFPTYCKDLTFSSVYFVADEGEYCASLLSYSQDENLYSLKSRQNILSGFSIINNKARFRLEIECDYSSVHPSYIIKDNLVKVKSRDSCGFYFEAGRLFLNHKVNISITMILLGFGMMTLGFIGIDFLIPFVGFALGFIFPFIVYLGLVDTTMEDAVYGGVTFLAFLFAFAIAYLFVENKQSPKYVIGFFFGYMLMMSVNLFHAHHIRNVS